MRGSLIDDFPYPERKFSNLVVNMKPGEWLGADVDVQGWMWRNGCGRPGVRERALRALPFSVDDLI